MDNASRDGNFVPTLLGMSSADIGQDDPETITIAVNPSTHAVIVELA